MEDKLEPKKEGVTFPIMGATSCPHCKSTKKLGKMAFDQLIKDKKIPPGTDWELKIATPIMQGNLSILDPTPVMLMMGVEYEICGNCFTMYATKINTLGIPMPGPQGGPQIFRK